MTDCKDDSCKVNVSEEQYKQLRKEFIRILIPSPEQRNPKSWAYATERRVLDELLAVVKLFIEKKK
ncbi:hypothetical protein LCGC14_2120150 [marine sediment metagenome]|uniref:Uncharacterized protein n=1 Tax=marine sediment metagenome TaxID=412755 RepID=A0A0F9E4I6_9ZZZZ